MRCGARYAEAVTSSSRTEGMDTGSNAVRAVPRWDATRGHASRWVRSPMDTCGCYGDNVTICSISTATDGGAGRLPRGATGSTGSLQRSLIWNIGDAISGRCRRASWNVPRTSFSNGERKGNETQYIEARFAGGKPTSMHVAWRSFDEETVAS